MIKNANHVRDISGAGHPCGSEDRIETAPVHDTHSPPQSLPDLLHRTPDIVFLTVPRHTRKHTHLLYIHIINIRTHTHIYIYKYISYTYTYIIYIYIYNIYIYIYIYICLCPATPYQETRTPAVPWYLQYRNSYFIDF
jgi:hypothetical protein